MSVRGAGGSCHSFGEAVDAHGAIRNGNHPEQGAIGMSIDELVERGLPTPDFIKIDVEGNEDSVLDGATKTLRRYHPAVLIEVEARHRARPMQECFERLRRLGYAGSWLDVERKRHPVTEFDVTKQQEPFDPHDPRYINMFLFEHRDLS